MTIARVYRLSEIRLLMKELRLPTSLRIMLKREGVQTHEIDGEIVWDADQVDEIIKELRR